MKSKRIRIVWTLIVAATAIVLAGCGLGQGRRQASSTPQPGDIVAAFVGDLAASASASGQLLPGQEARLALGTAGRVEQVHVRVGDEVRAGDVLVELKSDDLQRLVESAEQTLAIQEANLAELRKGPDARDVAAARASVANAQASLDDLLAGPSDEELAQAQASLDSAQARLDDLRAGPSAEELAQAQASLASARASLAAAQARYEALDDQLVVAQNDIHNAELAVSRAQDAYNLLIWNDWKAADSWGPYSPQAAALRSAQINYDVAVASYALTEINSNDSAYLSARAQVAQAEAALASLTEVKTAQIAAAEAQVARAEASLAALTGDRTAQIAGTRAQLAQAIASLAKLLDGASEEQLAIAEAQVEQANISLEDAQGNLAHAALLAPFDGIVTAVYVAVGERTSGVAIELINPQSLEVVLAVDEVDIGGIEAGQSTIVTLETWPDLELTGKVVSIAPTSSNFGEIVTYEVRLSLDAGDLPIRSGMTANAELITAERKDVLLVPNRAITADRSAGKYFVNKVDGEDITPVEVTIGMRDGSFTEIRGGIEVGDRLWIGEIEQALDFRSGPPEGVRGLR